MKQLTTRQIAYLRHLGQNLRPQVMIGHAGLTQGTYSTLEDALRTRELVKVRVLNTSTDSAKELASRMSTQARCVLVGVVGGTFVLYRPNPVLRERIELPAPSG